MSAGLEPMNCLKCGRILIPSSKEIGHTANSFEDCFYQCEICRVGYSNSQSPANRKMIHKCWEQNIPLEVHPDLHMCINRSLNETSRKKKFSRLSFDSSEDAVTWTVFRYLQQNSLLGTVFGLVNPRILYWGAELPKLETTQPDIERLLRLTLEELHEDPRRFSEPDIVLIDDQFVQTIEVKYRSGNSRKEGHPRFQNYVDAARNLFLQPDNVATVGYYELTRNVVFTKLLADKLNRRWKVTNLGQSSILASAKKFAEQLRDPTVFEAQAWPSICRQIPQLRSTWFQDYLNLKKGLEK